MENFVLDNNKLIIKIDDNLKYIKSQSLNLEQIEFDIDKIDIIDLKLIDNKLFFIIKKKEDNFIKIEENFLLIFKEKKEAVKIKEKLKKIGKNEYR